MPLGTSVYVREDGQEETAILAQVIQDRCRQVRFIHYHVSNFNYISCRDCFVSDSCSPLADE